MRFFTADTHHGHNNILEYEKRPFPSVEDMNEALITNWNLVVTPFDTVYHLGDFSFKGSKETSHLLQRLNGYKILIRGNHDDGALQMEKRGFGFAYESLGLKLGGHRVLLSHYPYRGQMADHREFQDRTLVDGGLWLLHGHVHSAWKVKDRMINVGVDVWDYTPVSEDRIIDEINRGNK